MRAMVVDRPGSPDVLRAADRPTPSPGPDEVAIDVAYAGVGFVDTLFRSGAFGVPTPFVPGLEVTGTVREVGPGVTGFSAGQRVAALLNDFGRTMRAGGYAEVAVAHTSMTVVLPADADLARIAGTLVNGVTAWIALHRLARLDTTDDVLVLGASGGLGSIAGHLAAINPARRVIGVVGSPSKKSAGPTPWTDQILGAELTDSVRALTGGRGVDVVIDPVGGDLRAQAFEALAPFGRLVLLGNASGSPLPLSTDAVWHGTRQVLGLSLGGVAHLIPHDVTTALGAVVGLTHRAVLTEPVPVVVPFDQVSEVHRALERRAAPSKTVLDLR